MTYALVTLTTGPGGTLYTVLFRFRKYEVTPWALFPHRLTYTSNFRRLFSQIFSHLTTVLGCSTGRPYITNDFGGTVTPLVIIIYSVFSGATG